MTELLGGVAGGLGLFFVGMWLLTENLKKLASRRLRKIAQRWTANRYSALLWGTLAGGVTQSMSALTFIVVSILRSRLVSTEGALAMILGGGIGVTTLVMLVTFDIKLASLYALGIAGAVLVSERLSKYRPVAGSCFGGAMIILGLVLLKEAAAPLAEQPWFRDMVEGSGDSLIFAFLVAALLTFIVQSSGAVSIFGISLAAVGVITIDQAIITIYGSFIGSSAILYVLSAKLTGRSRQAVMYMVIYNLLICAVAVPLLYCEIYLGVPSIKAWILAFDLDLDQQLALVYFTLAVFLLPLMLAGLGISARVLERLWPTSEIDELSRTQFIHDHASVDVETSLVLVDLEQRRVFRMLSQYFDLVRRRKGVEPLRGASRTVLSEIDEFLSDLQTLHPMQGVENRNALVNRQKLLSWLEDALAAKCEALLELADRSSLDEFRTSILEGVDSVFLSLVDAMDANDGMSWHLASRLTGDRSELMRKIRVHYLDLDSPLRKVEMINVLLITNAVEEVFFLLSKIEADFNPFSAEES
ncbi:MAG: Na/Pi symporter [Immundisolibacterales bacterium]|nr:Na/Pi symporter [Immundisolibacterales bacterium]